ncbi:hypothetical protein FA95DRAFT_767872 [Auriscalpium vulgare]|uniref:Uncharacterized protein n=1 Tax=Auriscalpium vulgare TaxID=40419 RepID=A0ACB8RAP3_9AGAM|nr:hypothetical protein FA95DRAFT_767872 [Auriscalpium vulgare]
MDRQYAQTNGLRTGYIYAGLESMNTPARLGLQMESNVVLPSVNSLQTSSTLLSLYQGDKKSRPCLVMRIDINRKTGQYEPIICIMGTFDGAPRDSLARFYQFHIVPVFPNSAVRISDKFVLHTTPHWKTKKWPAWLVCSPYPATDSTITTLWRGSEGDGFHLDEDALRQLQWEAARRRKAWQTIMADPQNKRMLQDNFMYVHRRRVSARSYKGGKMNQVRKLDLR